MKQCILLILVLVFAPVFAWGSAVAPPPASGQQNVEGKDANVWDFGSVKAGDILEHEFALTNNSAKDLIVKDTTTSCGCTVSEIKKKHLKPGDSTTVTVKFNTKGYSGPSIQFVYVNTDDIENPVIRFSVKAFVIAQN